MIGSGLIVSLIDGSGEKNTKAITYSTSSTVTFVISLVGIMCLWCGIMKIAEESGLTNKISKIRIKDDIGYKKIYMGWNKEAYISKIAEQFKEYVIKNINQW